MKETKVPIRSGKLKPPEPWPDPPPKTYPPLWEEQNEVGDSEPSPDPSRFFDIHRQVLDDPEWAASRIIQLEDAIDRIEKAVDKFERRLTGGI